MRKINLYLHAYRTDETGATAIEYGLIAALISLGVAASIFTFGDALNNLFFVELLDLFD